jgi:hypothetical protein
MTRDRKSVSANQASSNNLPAAPQLLTNDDLFSRVDAMDLEHVLGDIQTDRGNLHVDGSLM